MNETLNSQYVKRACSNAGRCPGGYDCSIRADGESWQCEVCCDSDGCNDHSKLLDFIEESSSPRSIPVPVAIILAAMLAVAAIAK